MAFLEYRPTRPLYHYCSAAAFESILKSKELWFTDLTESNDPRELGLGFDAVLEALTSVRHNEFSGPDGFFLSLLAGELAGIRERQTPFTCCFSLSGDSLPLWNEYTGYSGLSIGFRPRALLNIQARLQKVRYLDETTPNAIRNQVLEMAGALRSRNLDQTRSTDPDHIDREWISAVVGLFASITALKHASWSYEEEVRMIHLQTKERLPDEFLLVSERGEVQEWILPRESKIGSRTRKYVSYPFGKYAEGEQRHRRAIAKVILGPKCKLSRDQVEALLLEHAFLGVEIAASDCRIR